MRKNKWTAAGFFVLSLIILAAALFGNPSTFFENPTVHFWGPVALISGLVTMGEEIWRGASLAKSMRPLVRAMLGLLIIIGGLWVVTHLPLQAFPAHSGAPRGTGFLPQLLR